MKRLLQRVRRCRLTAEQGCVTEYGAESTVLMFRVIGTFLLVAGVFSLRSMTGGDCPCPLGLLSIQDTVRHVPHRAARSVSLDMVSQGSLLAREVTIHQSDSDTSLLSCWLPW